jgi:RecB family endonuclease NucS
LEKDWPYRFVHNEPKLKTRLSRAYDLQRALCEDPDCITKWFELVKNMQAKYSIQDADFYNFDETGFIWLLRAQIEKAEQSSFSLVIGNAQQRLNV